MKRSLIYMGIGAGLMYLFDPDMGEVRRGMLCDRFQELMPQTNEALASKMGEMAEQADDLTETIDSMAAEKVQPMD